MMYMYGVVHAKHGIALSESKSNGRKQMLHGVDSDSVAEECSLAVSPVV